MVMYWFCCKFPCIFTGQAAPGFRETRRADRGWVSGAFCDGMSTVRTAWNRRLEDH